MGNYKIIQDEKAFKEFIDWLPELEKDETYYLSLFARKKYDTTGTLKSDKSQIKRFTSDKKRMFDKVKKLEVELGSYRVKDIEVPDNTLALYITPNPRCVKKASLKTIKMLVDNIDKDNYQNPQAVALNALQVSKSRTVFVDFDVDNKVSDREGYKNYGNYLKDFAFNKTGSRGCFDIIETNGGYHVLVRPSDVRENFKKGWHQKISENQYIDQSGDLLLPVPGTTQGGFTPKFI